MAGRLRSFAVVGAIGFLIEAVVLTSLVRYASWTPLLARVPSFLLAVLATWWLNRQHTFAGRGLARTSVEASLYLGIQFCGAALNFLVFGVCLHWLPVLASIPVIPLAVGATGGFAFNFAACNWLLYSQSRRGARN